MILAGAIFWMLTASILIRYNSSPTNLTLTGTIVSVDTTNHTVTISVNGQTKTIINVPSNVLTTLQNQVGKVYGFQVTQNSDGSYSLQSGTNVTPESNETPTINSTPGFNQSG